MTNTIKCASSVYFSDPKNCYSLRPVENATPEVLLGNTVDNPHGTVVRYTCNEGYSMEGNNERYCVNGEWSEVKFTCTIMQGIYFIFKM